MKFKLLESILIEDIAAVKRQYAHIPEDDFDKIIRLDPTFDENRDSVGKYGKWLLGLYKKDNPLNSNVNIPEMLSQYDSLVKDRAKQIEKDTGKFKSISEMQNAIENVGEAELSDRQKLRQKQANKDYDLVYQNDDWAIFVPNTWEADVNLGKGTSWCTADSREEHGKKFYDQYLQQGGKYYVIINKKDKSDKYQFHFESNQFMDKNDNKINVEEFCNKNGLTDFFKKEGYDIENYGVDITVKNILDHIDFETILTIKDLQILSPIFNYATINLLELYDFVENNSYIEYIFDDDYFSSTLESAAEKLNIEISENVNKQYAYESFVNMINNNYTQYYLSSLTGKYPVQGTDLEIIDDDIVLNADVESVEQYVYDMVTSYDVQYYDDVYSYAKDDLYGLINYAVNLDFDNTDIPILLMATTDWNNVHSTIDMNSLYELLVEACLLTSNTELNDIVKPFYDGKTNFDVFCEYYASQLIEYEDADYYEAHKLSKDIFKIKEQ